MTVSNSTPLIYLSKLNQLWLLRELLEDIKVPDNVLEEVAQGKNLGFEDAGVVERAEKEGWIKRIELTREQDKKVEELRDSFPQLSKGDASAIILANELEDIVCLDDSSAVKAAETLGIKHIGTLGIILKAANDGHIKISKAREIVISLPDQGFNISHDLIAEFLKKSARQRKNKNTGLA